MGLIVIILALFGILVSLVARYKNPQKKLDRQFRGYLAAFTLSVVILAGIPFVVILNAGNGINILKIRYVQGWADPVAVLSDIAIPFFLVGFPWLLSGERSWEKDNEKTIQVLSAWLTAFAAAATAVFILALHFLKGGQLAKLNITLVLAACLATVTLVMPAYTPLARACLQRKLNLKQWWTDQSKAWRNVWRVIQSWGGPSRRQADMDDTRSYEGPGSPGLGPTGR